MLFLAERQYVARPASLPVGDPQPVALRWQTLTLRQKRSLLILPALAAVGSPAMALLPALAQQINPENAAGLALPLLFARSLGQLCGPLLLRKESLTRFAARSPLLLSCLALFLAAYGLLPFLSAWVVLALGMIFIAHLASNIVFAAGTFGVLSNFQAIQISAASGKASALANVERFPFYGPRRNDGDDIGSGSDAICCLCYRTAVGGAGPRPIIVNKA